MKTDCINYGKCFRPVTLCRDDCIFYNKTCIDCAILEGRKCGKYGYSITEGYLICSDFKDEGKGMSKDKKSSYYDAGGIETLDVIKAKLTDEQFKGYLLGNVIKYASRMMHKTPGSPLRDAEKTANYSRWLKEFLDHSN